MRTESRLALVAAILAATALIGAAILLDGGGDEGAGGPGPAAAANPPNIVVVMTDDQGPQTLTRGLPRTVDALRRRGTRFGNAIITTPLCCPSRASFLSGQYGHNNGVLANDPGYPELSEPKDVLPVWMRRAGYRTSLVGKFLNGYDRTSRGARERAAPGWDEWSAMKRPFSYYDFELYDGEETTAYSGEKSYLTDVLTERALDSIDRLAGDPEPLFMWLSYWAPHNESSEETGGECQGQAIPRSRDTSLFPEASLPGAPRAVDEADASDKPRYISTKRRFRPRDRERARVSHRCALGALRAVDEGVVEVRNRLRKLGELKNTVFVFFSDNGFMFGEHRLIDGKSVPYEESIRVPMMIDLPKRMGDQPRRISAPVANVDLAPTIRDLAGLEPCLGGRCRAADGTSLVAALRGRKPAPADRAILVEADQGRPCPFRAVRTNRYLLASYEETDFAPCRQLERELYDLRRDPVQLDNLLVTDPGPSTRAIASRLERTLARLIDCEGRRGPRGCDL